MRFLPYIFLSIVFIAIAIFVGVTYFAPSPFHAQIDPSKTLDFKLYQDEKIVFKNTVSDDENFNYQMSIINLNSDSTDEYVIQVHEGQNSGDRLVIIYYQNGQWQVAEEYAYQFNHEIKTVDNKTELWIQNEAGEMIQWQLPNDS